jgi:hypothetical protein
MWKRLPGMKSRGFICRWVLVLAVGDGLAAGAQAVGDALATAEADGDALAAAEADGHVLAAAEADAPAAAPPLAFAVCWVVV